MCSSSNDRLYKILQAEKDVTISIDIEFVNDETWKEIIEEQLKHPSEEWKNEEYKEYVRNETRAYEIDGKIYFKKSAQKDEDFRRLLLHELGHAVCDFYHVGRDGDIMNSNYKNWYGCGHKDSNK